jgi:hypothetical protein
MIHGRLMAALLFACSGAGAGEQEPGPEPVSFARDIAPLLKTRCAICHMTGQEPGSMALHPGKAYASLVNMASVQSALLRVKPGAPEQSYLLLKLDGTHLDAGGQGVRMPFGMAPLDEITRQRIRDWIAAGAANN